MQRSNSEHESLHDEETIFFSPKSNNTPKGSSEQTRGPSASGSRSASPSRSGEHLKAALARETSPLRGSDLKGKGRQHGYDAASNSSSSNLLASAGERAADRARYQDDNDDDAAMLSYGAGYDPSRDDGDDIPTLQRLVGGSHRTLDGRMPHHLPRRGSSRRQGYSEYSTVEMEGHDKDAMFDDRLRPLTAAEKKKEYWKSAIANLGLILSWCECIRLLAAWRAAKPRTPDRLLLDAYLGVQQVDVFDSALQVLLSALRYILSHDHTVPNHRTSDVVLRRPLSRTKRKRQAAETEPQGLDGQSCALRISNGNGHWSLQFEPEDHYPNLLQ